MKELYKYISKKEVLRAKNPIVENGISYSNPTEETLRNMGYKEMEVEPMPVQEGFYASPVYENGETIKQGWEFVKIEEEAV